MAGGDLTPGDEWVVVIGEFDDPAGHDYRQTFPDLTSAMNYAQDLRGIESYFVMLAVGTTKKRPERKPRKPARKWSTLTPATKARWRRAGVGPNTYNAGTWSRAQGEKARGAPKTPGHPKAALRDPVRYASYIAKHKTGLAELFGITEYALEDMIREVADVRVHLYVDTEQQRGPRHR